MTNKIFFIILFLSVPILFLTCKKSNLCNSVAVPPVFFFQIKESGIIISDSILASLKISYFVNGSKEYISDLSQATDFYANKGILTSRQIGTFQDQTFFIEYPDADIDTLMVSNILPSPSTNCEYKISKIEFNNSIISKDTSFGYQPVYIFNKH